MRTSITSQTLHPISPEGGNGTQKPSEERSPVDAVVDKLEATYRTLRTKNWYPHEDKRRAAFEMLQEACNWAKDETHPSGFVHQIRTSKNTADSRPIWVYRLDPVCSFDSISEGHLRISINACVCPALLEEIEKCLDVGNVAYKFGAPEASYSLQRNDVITMYFTDLPSPQLLSALAKVVKRFPRAEGISAENDGLWGTRIIVEGEAVPGIVVEPNILPTHVEALMKALASCDPLLKEAIEKFKEISSTDPIRKPMIISTGAWRTIEAVAAERGITLTLEPYLAGFTIVHNGKTIIADPKRTYHSWDMLAKEEPFKDLVGERELRALFLDILPRPPQSDSALVMTVRESIDITPGNNPSGKIAPSIERFEAYFRDLGEKTLSPGRQMLLEFVALHNNATLLTFTPLDDLLHIRGEEMRRLYPPLRVLKQPLFGHGVDITSHLVTQRRGIVPLQPYQIGENLLLGIADALHEKLCSPVPEGASDAFKDIATCEKSLRGHLLAAHNPIDVELETRIMIGEITKIFTTHYDPNDRLDFPIQQLVVLKELREWIAANDKPGLTLQSPEVVEKAKELVATYPVFDWDDL